MPVLFWQLYGCQTLSLVPQGLLRLVIRHIDFSAITAGGVVRWMNSTHFTRSHSLNVCFSFLVNILQNIKSQGNQIEHQASLKEVLGSTETLCTKVLIKQTFKLYHRFVFCLFFVNISTDISLVSSNLTSCFNTMVDEPSPIL